MRKRVLVVDDERNIRTTISLSLRTLDVDVDCVISGEEALERLVMYQYDLVLLDLRLPGMSGVELIERLKELDVPAKVVVISAHGTIDVAVKLMKAGALDFIEKPFALDDIRQIVNKYL